MYYHIIKPTKENGLKEHTIKSFEFRLDFRDDKIQTFGRLDYAQHWCDYYNGKITKEEHIKWIN